MIRLHPQPTSLELQRVLSNRILVSSETDTVDRMEQWYRRFVLRDHLHFVERALRESEAKGHCADAGCGGGLFLQMLAERGATSDVVAGLDFSMDAAHAAWWRAGVPAVCATLRRRRSRRQLRRGHDVPRPGTPLRSGSYLRAAHELLAPEGRLIIQVPNAACWQFLLLGERWTGIDVPRHLIDFRASDFDRLLDKLRLRSIAAQAFFAAR